ncbi:GNAT family N-acetyltransferase [Verminephrobacter eiseniae]|uniref:GNAT family N-acetyltransferase n=1 Tax=Verminephrobacter eiseniae TaxID=364317 RepID=UPI00223783C0|nr:GNAT family N-acetyltransferase [Verminephrobacter eiseniae]
MLAKSGEKREILLIKLRPATPADAAGVAALHAESWRQTYRGVLTDEYLDQRLDADRLNDWQRRLNEPPAGQYVVVLETDDAGRPDDLMGFACAYGAYDVQAGTLLENLHAHPEKKQRGTGRLLLGQIARWSLQHYPDNALHLWVVAPNQSAISFYRHMRAVEDAQAVWHAPDGSRIPELRYIWRDPSLLLTEPLSRCRCPWRQGMHHAD